MITLQSVQVLHYNAVHLKQVFPGGSDGNEFACNAGDRVRSLGQESPLEKGWQPTSVFLPGELHGQRRLVGYSP